ncbi:MAG: hypothetical protein ACXWV8_01575, partial [Chitinophagaceae bacterium]
MSYQVPTSSANSRHYRLYLVVSLLLVLIFIIAFGGYKIVFTNTASASEATTTMSGNEASEEKKAIAPVLASPEEYDRKIKHITNG